MEREVSRREFLKASATTGALLAAGSTMLSFADRKAFAKELQEVQLSKPQTESGNPVLRLLEKRASSRELSIAFARLDPFKRALGCLRDKSNRREAYRAVCAQCPGYRYLRGRFRRPLSLRS